MEGSPYFKSSEESLLLGMFLGTLVSRGIEAFPEVDDHGYYTDVVVVILEFEGNSYPVHLRWVPKGSG